MTGPIVHVDFETFSGVDLVKSGAYVYAAHPSTDILCMAWAIGDDEPQLWLPGDDFPIELAPAWIGDAARFIAHNSSFERLIWRLVGVRKYGFPPIDDDAWWCTAAQAANMGLPRDLDGAASALGGAQQKDPTGRRIMLQLSKPRAPTKDNPATRWTPEMASEKFEHLYEYCRQDVRAERGIDGRLYALSPMERDLFRLDQTINDRGIRIDRALIEASKKVVDQAVLLLDEEMRQATQGAVEACTQVGRLSEWLRARPNCECDGVGQAEVARLLARDDIGQMARRALLARAEAGKSSTAKLDAMLASAGSDDRIRGSLLYCGAARTRRWSGRLHQPQNFPRGDEVILNDIEGAVRALATGNADVVRLLYGNPMEVVSSCLRAMMIAADGHDLMACDFANIEGRVLAWMAGETWKLDAFRAYDAGTGPDLYKVAYARAYGGPAANVTKQQRQVGKVMELACGYQGWVGAFQTFAKLYGVDFPDEEAAKNAGAWREAHPKVTRLWRDLNGATLRAVARPGVKFEAGPVTYLFANDFLWCRLPSGGTLAYCRPTIEKNDRGEDAVHFFGTNSRTRKWEKQSGYGGLWCENIDQAISRDLLAAAMVRLEAAGYPLVLTVHDELVAEVPRGGGAETHSVEAMEQIAAVLPPWAAGLPVSAAGWRAERYQK